MLVKLSIVLVFVLSTIYAQTYSCRGVYKPTDYIGEPRVPSDCKVERLDCPASWKSGIPEGSDTSPPMIDQKFLNCHEGFTLCGYVPIDPESGEVLGNSGVTVGTGVDFGSKSRSYFTSLNISQKLVDKVEPYLGLTRELAACAAIERPLTLTAPEANNLTNAVKTDFINTVSRQYDSDKHANALAFSTIPRGIRTAIVSVWYQFGDPSKLTKFWNFVTTNDWDNAIKELRNFYANPDKQAKGDLKRRNNEADIIEATLSECNRSVDVVFLIDESGSVGSTNFQKSLDFVKNMTKAFPDDKLSGKDGTRFGLSTFESSYKSHFYLSNYTSQSAYLSAISRVSYSNGGTNLGRALGEILTDQFTEERGLRPEVDGVPRVLIVLTDGRSSDSVSSPAKNVRDENIVIYAIGIANYNIEQLKEIASSESHVYMLSTFTQLDKFISTLTASTCYESRPVSLNETIITNVKKDTYQYFSYNVKESSNLEISVVDLIGSTFVYVSRTNPHPYKYDHDIAFDLSSQTNKLIVISPNAPASNDTRRKRSTDNDRTRQIFVSVTSDSDSASFKIEGKECDPLNCTEGTNEIPTTQPPTTQLPSTQPPTTQLPSTEPPTTQVPSTQNSTTQLPTTPLATPSASATPTAETPTSSARVVVAARFVVVCFAMLMMLFDNI